MVKDGVRQGEGATTTMPTTPTTPTTPALGDGGSGWRVWRQAASTEHVNKVTREEFPRKC